MPVQTRTQDSMPSIARHPGFASCVHPIVAPACKLVANDRAGAAARAHGESAPEIADEDNSGRDPGRDRVEPRRARVTAAPPGSAARRHLSSLNGMAFQDSRDVALAAV